MNLVLRIKHLAGPQKKTSLYNFWGQRKPFVGEWNTYHREARETWKPYLKHNHNVMVFVSIPNKF